MESRCTGGLVFRFDYNVDLSLFGRRIALLPLGGRVHCRRGPRIRNRNDGVGFLVASTRCRCSRIRRFVGFGGSFYLGACDIRASAAWSDVSGSVLQCGNDRRWRFGHQSVANCRCPCWAGRSNHCSDSRRGVRKQAGKVKLTSSIVVTTGYSPSLNRYSRTAGGVGRRAVVASAEWVLGYLNCHLQLFNSLTRIAIRTKTDWSRPFSHVGRPP